MHSSDPPGKKISRITDRRSLRIIWQEIIGGERSDFSRTKAGRTRLYPKFTRDAVQRVRLQLHPLAVRIPCL